MVPQDIRDDLISPEKAEQEYGVVVDRSTLEVDVKATEQVRSRR